LEKYGKKDKSGGEKTSMDDKGKATMEDPLAHGNESGFQTGQSEGLKAGKNSEGDKGYLDNLGNEEDDFNESEDDLLDSQDLEEFIKDEELILSPSQEKGKMSISATHSEDAGKEAGVKKGGSMEGEFVEGVRRSSRLESNDEMKIADKSTARAMAKDAFINKGTSYNPFSVLNIDNVVLMDVAHKLGVELGSSFNEAVENLDLIKSLELSRKNLVVQSVKCNFDPNKSVIHDSDMDNSVHNEGEDNALTDLENVMVLRKGRKIRHRKKSVRKKKDNKSPKHRNIPIKRKGLKEGLTQSCSE
jgi:hypothetical protein